MIKCQDCKKDFCMYEKKDSEITTGDLAYFIATDKYNILRGRENRIIYFFKKLYYRVKLYIGGI